MKYICNPMKKGNVLNNGIPVSISLDPALEVENFEPQKDFNKKRILLISCLSFFISIVVSFIAKLLVYLIYFFTNVSFFGNFSFHYISPADNTLGIFVIAIPLIGGLVVGLIALYGSEAIRGHGIPEAMEQILTNQSKIKPVITFFKPLSAAISIGTGGPFGAEGPIIATGGALGSTIGQLTKITHNERKILLAAGATAGMAAIFGSPVAAIFLAIELLLFEFSPRSIIPVSIACVTGAAGHHFLFGTGPVFSMLPVTVPGNWAIATYSVLGIIIGLLSVVVSKAIYIIEDAFEKIPIHWMWWPAIGGIAVGVIGYFAPSTLGVGYDNITNLLIGNTTLYVLFSLFLLKFISWAIALGSGTSGGTLAPLLTIGGAAGALLGRVFIHYFPGSGITIPLAALIGMSAMFAGASRALLTSIIFAVETTSQSNAILPLLGACVASYFVSFFLMKNTIMTEKIARRGIKTPDSFVPDLLEKISVGQVIKENGIIFSEDNTIEEIREWLGKEPDYKANYFVISSDEGEYKGIVSSSTIMSHLHQTDEKIGALIKRKTTFINIENSLRSAVEMMAKENVDILPVVAKENSNNLIGILAYQDIISAYKQQTDEHEKNRPSISLKIQSLRILLRGQKLFALKKKKTE
jgi:chloride channel protein, CIC family